jgi:Tropinone reductase 1
MTNSKWTLKGKKAVITGGSKGIGLACVEEFLDLGAEVIFTARDKDEIETVVRHFKNQGFTIFGLVNDASIAQERCKLIEFTKKIWPYVDILVNNVGYNDHKATLDYREDEIKKLLETNLLSTYEYCREFFPLLCLSSEPCIINIASIAGLTNTSSGTPYAMSKAAIIQLTKNLAVEWAPFNIRVNSIAPGLIETPLTDFWNQEERRELLEYFYKRVPMKRKGNVKEISAPIAFLAMPVASYISGQCLTIDGGFTINTF